MSNIDYSFMKTGLVGEVTQPSISEIDFENIEILLSLFMSNGITNAAKYVKYCKKYIYNRKKTRHIYENSYIVHAML